MSGEDSRAKGKLFEQQVARFLEKQGWEPTLGRHFDGKIAVRKHDCDIFARKIDAGWVLAALSGFVLAVGAGAGALDGTYVEYEWPLTIVGLLVGLFCVTKSTKYAWIECKNLQQSIKRDLIMKLKDQFKDSRAPLVGSWECWLVSTSRFDEDAVAHAKAHGVRCYQAVGAGERGMALHEVRATTGDV